MLLRSLEVKNFRSLEHVKLEGMDRFNVLVGRNNSGKSAVFGALSLLGQVMRQEHVDWDRAMTGGNRNLSIEISLGFGLREEERREWISLLYPGGDESTDRRRENAFASPLLRHVSYTFNSPARISESLHMSKTTLRAEDNRWVTVQDMSPERSNSIGTESRIIRLGQVASSEPLATLDSKKLDLSNMTFTGGARLGMLHYLGDNIDHGSAWLWKKLVRYLNKAFFFEPFRRSRERAQVTPNAELARDGSNLAQTLHTLSSNDRPTFEKIERFVEAALPGIGILHTPLHDVGSAGNAEVGVGFRPSTGGYMIPLHDTGGGVEQLLMVATVLLTTGDESSLFLEEPEGHLHAGAQRYLIERLYEGDRQIFVTTHSPTFVNLSRPKSIYLVNLSQGSTEITWVRNANHLGEVLEDIGARNSDVLLSDAVLFVEGSGDKEVFGIWANKLSIELTERNVAVLPMSGGEQVSRSARVRTDVLEGISSRASVPHLFVVDQDERGVKEIEKLQRQLGDKLHVLERRELENYLLVPRAILAALKSKHSEDAEILGQLEQASEGEMQSLIDRFTKELYGLVLLKRIRSEVAGLAEGLMPRAIAEHLATHADDQQLHEVIREALENRVANHLSGLALESIVREQKEALSKEWSEANRRMQLAPGTEVLEKVFEHFGSKYNKPKDTTRLAQHMSLDEIPIEAKELLSRVARLASKD